MREVLFLLISGGICGLLGWLVGSSRAEFWKNRAAHFEAEARRLAKVAADEQFKNRHFVRIERVSWSTVDALTSHETFQGDE